MFLTMQFPIADTRPFLPESANLLPSPSWPLPQADRQFVRYFGLIRQRPLGGAGVHWMGDELYFCDARRAIRLPNLGPDRGKFPQWGRRRLILRRLFQHKPALARIELSFAIDAWTSHINGDRCINRVAEILTIPTKVPAIDGGSMRFEEHPLILQGSHLARLFSRATSVPNHDSVAGNEWAVRDGEPMVLVEYSREEVSSMPSFAREFYANDHLVHYMTVRAHGRNVTVWFLAADAFAEGASSRQLRMCLLRLHLEFQALMLVLNTVCDRPEYQSSFEPAGRLNDYLDEATSRLFRTNRFGVKQRQFYLAMAAYRELISKDRFQLLKNKLERLKKEVADRVQRLIDFVEPASSHDAAVIEEKHGKITYSVQHLTATNLYLRDTIMNNPINVTQSGPGNVAAIGKNISDVKADVKLNQNVSENAQALSELLKELAKEINSLPTTIDELQSARLKAALQTLETETRLKEPRAAWYQLSLQGLKDAAHAVGDLGAPIIEIAGKLAALLFG